MKVGTQTYLYTHIHSNIIFKSILFITLLQFSQFFPLYHPSALHSQPSCIPHPPRSCPWFILINSLISVFSIPFLTSPHLFYVYQLCFLVPVPFPPILLLSLPTEKSPYDLHFSGWAVVLVVCLVFVFVC